MTSHCLRLHVAREFRQMGHGMSNVRIFDLKDLTYFPSEFFEFGTEDYLISQNGNSITYYPIDNVFFNTVFSGTPEMTVSGANLSLNANGFMSGTITRIEFGSYRRDQIAVVDDIEMSAAQLSNWLFRTALGLPGARNEFSQELGQQIGELTLAPQSGTIQVQGFLSHLNTIDFSNQDDRVDVNDVFSGTLTLNGNGGFDVLDLPFTPTSIVNLDTGVASYGNGQIVFTGFEKFVGNSRVAEFIGSSGADSIDAGWGDQIVNAADGNDTVQGNRGDDLINGDQGADMLSGGSDQDTIDGGQGNDFIVGGSENDLLNGGDGNDLVYADDVDVIANSDIADQIFRLYQATLDRNPDAGGYANWTGKLANKEMSIVEIASGFVNSQEFQNVYGSLSNQEFVTLLYNNVLDRAPDDNGLANWTSQLDGGRSRESVVVGFSNSAEFRQNTEEDANAFARGHLATEWTDDVFRLYQATLGRNPDKAGMLNWTDQLANGTPFLTVVDGFVRSQEFQNTYGALDDQAFVTLLYNNVLDRAPDDAGLANWTGFLANGGTREHVVRGFSQSQEFKNTSQDDVKTWVEERGAGDILLGGNGNDKLIGGMFEDTFVIDATQMGQDTIFNFEVWDDLSFEGFDAGFASDPLSHFSQDGADVVMSYNGTVVRIDDFELADMSTDMFQFV